MLVKGAPLRAASITGPASAGVLDNSAYKMGDRKPWLAQEAQSVLSAAERVAALSMKVEGDQSRVEFQSAGAGAPASGESKGRKGRASRLLIIMLSSLSVYKGTGGK